MPLTNGSWNFTRPTAEELADILAKHLKWRNGEKGGSRANLTRANLTDANLTRANLTRANLTRANLTDANLTRANLTRANLTGANLTGAYLTDAKGLPFTADDIAVPSLHRQMLAAINGHPSRFDMSTWHACETTHCRAGWAITLAGKTGMILEKAYGPSVAGALITLASCPWMERVPNWTDTNENAMADIKACAEREPELTTTEAGAAG